MKYQRCFPSLALTPVLFVAAFWWHCSPHSSEAKFSPSSHQQGRETFGFVPSARRESISYRTFCHDVSPHAKSGRRDNNNRSADTFRRYSSEYRRSDSSSDDGSYRAGVTLESLASKLSESRYKNIVVVMGAGASVSAGIPDFRTPGTGLYDKMSHYNLPYPEAVFDLSYYRTNPQPFVDLAKELWPGQEGGPRPTLAHSFVQLLEEKGLLCRCYTQNIDGLERIAGVSEDKLVECHGNFRSSSCTNPACRTVDDTCMDDTLKGKVPLCEKCGSVTKPDIVFFGEELPIKFQNLIEDDVDMCDLLIVLGTSLQVMPVAGIPGWVGTKCPRLLINRELVGDFATEAIMVKNWGGGYSRDVFLEGDCDDGVRDLCELIGWEKELDTMHDKVS